MAKLTIGIEDPSFVATPAAGSITVFADSTDNNIPKYKTSDGVIHEFSGDSILKIEKTFSDFVSAGFDSEVVLAQIPAKSLLNTVMVKMDTEFLTSGFSNVKLQIFLRDVNGDATMRDIYVQAPVPTEGIYITDIEFSSMDSPNVGAQIGAINTPTNVVLNHDNPIDIIARLRVDSENFGLEAPMPNSYEVTDIVTLPDVADNLSGKHFLISEVGTDYYVWYDTGASVDPAVVGATPVQVSIDINDPADVVAFKTALAIRNSGANIVVYQFGDKIRCVEVSKTNITDTLDVTTGFTINTLTQGGGAVKVINDLIQGAFSVYLQFTKLL